MQLTDAMISVLTERLVRMWMRVRKGEVPYGSEEYKMIYAYTRLADHHIHTKELLLSVYKIAKGACCVPETPKRNALSTFG